MDRLHDRKSGKPVIKFYALCAQSPLYPGGILKFSIGLIKDFSGGLIEALQSLQE
jgi:hypothetical protein